MAIEDITIDLDTSSIQDEYQKYEGTPFSMTFCRSQPLKKNVLFEPIPLGMRFRRNGVIEVVPNYEAANKGVDIGWIVIKINNNNMPNQNSIVEAIKKAKDVPTKIS